MYEILTTCGKARRARLETPHGVIETPVFMNVGTAAAIRGGASTDDLREIKTLVELSNTYHLHMQPGEDLIARLGGLHKFMNWDKPILTDSGGFQVFSLQKIRRIKEEGAYFTSYIDGRKIFMGPEESMQIQSKLGSDIAMTFDECIENPAPRDYVEKSVARTTRWLKRCIEEHRRLASLPETINPGQLLFGINQGGVYDDIRVEHMKEIAKIEGLDGFAIGGLSVGETADEMYRIIDAVEPHMPKDKPRYLMGVGTPLNILEGVHRGIDFFDCVLPLRNAQHGNVFTWNGKVRILAEKFKYDGTPIDENCGCPACRSYSKGYIRHLL
ncbi:MAG: tRNA guanosine(34) transglycosylase Tgt, partial [Oscillospiraceae bacterium]|nr:tRNA guanosine(34) transglycosylase Tgt [Oscillospiraceae bacterium]